MEFINFKSEQLQNQGNMAFGILRREEKGREATSTVRTEQDNKGSLTLWGKQSTKHINDIQQNFPIN